jgi:hypothetical protein
MQKLTTALKIRANDGRDVLRHARAGAKNNGRKRVLGQSDTGDLNPKLSLNPLGCQQAQRAQSSGVQKGVTADWAVCVQSNDGGCMGQAQKMDRCIVRYTC